MLGIVPGSATANHGTQSGSGNTGTPTRASQRKKTTVDIVPARFIKTTTVKENTLNPVWNEKFKL